MFDFKGFVKTLSIPLLYLIMSGLVLGFIEGINIPNMLFIFFIPSYLFTGIFSPYWNPTTPYFTSYFTSLSLGFLSILSGQYLYGFETLTNAEGINRSLVFSTSISLIITYIYLHIKMKKRPGAHYNV